MANWKRIKRQNEANRRKKNQEAKLRFYASCYEIESDDVEQWQWTHTTFKKDGKFYLIVDMYNSPSMVTAKARSTGLTDYRIIHKTGLKTPFKNGEFIDFNID